MREEGRGRVGESEPEGRSDKGSMRESYRHSE